MRMDFERLYRKLNAKQKEAVDSIDGPVMVVAGPGTGKTTVLTMRIANILKRTDTPAHGILALTYTDAGVRAMRNKLIALIGNRAHDVMIYTFHSFSSSMIMDYPDHFIHLSGVKQMTEIDQESMLRTILKEPKFSELRPVGRPDAYMAQIIGSIELCKREAITPEMAREYALSESDRIKNDESSISTRGVSKGKLKAEALESMEKCERTALFADVYARYEEQKHQTNRMDYSDLIIEVLFAMRKDELLLRLIQERFLYVLVDEHQDTNDAQNYILGYIAEFFETPNIFIVGDEKQAIYRFQGASVENFLLLRKRWPSMKVISLDENYRSHQKILDASFSMIEHNYGEGENKDLRIRLSSRCPHEEKPIEVITAGNTSAGEKYLVKELEAIRSREPQSTVAVIVRRNIDLDRVIRLLEGSGIPVSSERSVDIFNHPIGSLFFDLLEYLSDSSKADFLSRTIVSGMWDLSFQQSSSIIRSLKSLNTDSSEDTSSLEKRIPSLIRIKAMFLSDDPVGSLIKVAQYSGYESLVSSNPSYIYVWRGIVALAESLIRESDIREPIKLIEQMLSYRTSAQSKSVKVSVGSEQYPFHAMTAHASKGLEFDYVFIPYATEEAWIGKAKGASFVLPKKRADTGDIRDIRRLFYVALTRAQKHAVIVSPLSESDGKELSPLRFISELDEATVSSVSIPREDMEIPGFHLSEQFDSDNARNFVDAAKNEILEKGISVTALNRFLKCPSEFLYQSVLRLPQAATPMSEKGTCMHEAISAVWAAKADSVPEIEGILKSRIESYMRESFLPMFEKDAIKKELLENAPIVAQSLSNHFSDAISLGRANSIFTEFTFKNSFEHEVGTDKIRIVLHGKLDAVIDDGTELKVYDYKTKQAMSLSAIKGETKNSDGSYWRQLLFYKILLANNSMWRDRKISPALIFVSPNARGECKIVECEASEADFNKLKDQIRSLIESVWKGDIVKSSCKEKSCRWCGLKRVFVAVGNRPVS